MLYEVVIELEVSISNNRSSSSSCSSIDRSSSSSCSSSNNASGEEQPAGRLRIVIRNIRLLCQRIGASSVANDTRFWDTGWD